MKMVRIIREKIKLNSKRNGARRKMKQNIRKRKENCAYKSY
jgi:hypothetical protein